MIVVTNRIRLFVHETRQSHLLQEALKNTEIQLLAARQEVQVLEEELLNIRKKLRLLNTPPTPVSKKTQSVMKCEGVGRSLIKAPGHRILP